MMISSRYNWIPSISKIGSSISLWKMGFLKLIGPKEVYLDDFFSFSTVFVEVSLQEVLLDLDLSSIEGPLEQLAYF